MVIVQDEEGTATFARKFLGFISCPSNKLRHSSSTPHPLLHVIPVIPLNGNPSKFIAWITGVGVCLPPESSLTDWLPQGCYCAMRKMAAVKTEQESSSSFFASDFCDYMRTSQVHREMVVLLLLLLSGEYRRSRSESVLHIKSRDETE